jgi:hypothetical protein
MRKTALAAACGLYCGDCEYLGNKCPGGCNEAQGKPFWAPMLDIEVCPVYDCCVNQKQLEHCGLCPEFPCKAFISLRDPSLSDEEAEQSLYKRQQDLRRRKEVGTRAWLKERL